MGQNSHHNNQMVRQSPNKHSVAPQVQHHMPVQRGGGGHPTQQHFAMPSNQQQMYQQPQYGMQQQPQFFMVPPEDMIGAIKIKDGLFIGDEYAAQDLEFVVANKVTHVVNCAGKQIANHWESIGVVYLTFFWMDSENQILFDSGGHDKTAKQIFDFIEQAARKSESVLVHSVRGQSRAASVLACYMMQKYRWSMIKTLEFLNSRRPELEIKASFIQQLQEFEHRLNQKGQGPLSFTFNECSYRVNGQRPAGLRISDELEAEEVILRNTFVNAQTKLNGQGGFGPSNQNGSRTQPILLKWTDHQKQRQPLAKEGPQGNMRVLPPNQKVTTHRQHAPSSLKGSLKKNTGTLGIGAQDSSTVPAKPANDLSNTQTSVLNSTQPVSVTGAVKEQQSETSNNVKSSADQNNETGNKDTSDQQTGQPSQQTQGRSVNLFDQNKSSPKNTNQAPAKPASTDQQNNTQTNDELLEVEDVMDNDEIIQNSGQPNQQTPQQTKNGSSSSQAQGSQQTGPTKHVTNIITNNNINNYIINSGPSAQPVIHPSQIQPPQHHHGASSGHSQGRSAAPPGYQPSPQIIKQGKMTVPVGNSGMVVTHGAEQMAQQPGQSAQVMVRRNRLENDSFRNHNNGLSPKTAQNPLLGAQAVQKQAQGPLMGNPNLIESNKVQKRQSLGGANLQSAFNQQKPQQHSIAGISANFPKQKVTVNQENLSYYQRQPNVIKGPGPIRAYEGYHPGSNTSQAQQSQSQQQAVFQQNRLEHFGLLGAPQHGHQNQRPKNQQQQKPNKRGGSLQPGSMNTANVVNSSNDSNLNHRPGTANPKRPPSPNSGLNQNNGAQKDPHANQQSSSQRSQSQKPASAQHKQRGRASSPMTSEIQQHNQQANSLTAIQQKKQNSNKMFQPLMPQSSHQFSQGAGTQNPGLSSSNPQAKFSLSSKQPDTAKGYSPGKSKWKSSLTNSLPSSQVYAGLTGSGVGGQGGMGSYMGGVSIQGSTYPRGSNVGAKSAKF